jgi:hypothetical protein
MTSTITTENNVLTITLQNGMRLEYSPRTDSRVFEAVDGKLFTQTIKGARQLAAEMQAWGVSEARADNYAVVFWT